MNRQDLLSFVVLVLALGGLAGALTGIGLLAHGHPVWAVVAFAPAQLAWTTLGFIVDAASARRR